MKNTITEKSAISFYRDHVIIDGEKYEARYSFDRCANKNLWSIFFFSSKEAIDRLAPINGNKDSGLSGIKFTVGSPFFDALVAPATAYELKELSEAINERIATRMDEYDDPVAAVQPLIKKEAELRAECAKTGDRTEFVDSSRIKAQMELVEKEEASMEGFCFFPEC